MYHIYILIFYISLQKDIISARDVNLTSFLNQRQGRSLIYQGGGSLKFSVGGIWPLYLEDRVNWRQMNCLASLISQYDLPVKPSRPFDQWELPYGKSFQNIREEFDRTGFYEKDLSRMFIYAALEEFMDRNGRNGRECLLRSICENAQVDEHGDVYSRIISIILSPGQNDLDKVYENAKEAGKFGANCFSAYPKCTYGDSFLDRVATLT